MIYKSQFKKKITLKTVFVVQARVTYVVNKHVPNIRYIAGLGLHASIVLKMLYDSI